MSSTIRRPLSSICLLLTMLTAACARNEAPPPQPPPPGVISRVTAAKTIFLSNAGVNDYFANDIPGGANVAYNELYAALQQWGYFQLADSPAHADLIFQIRGTERMPQLERTGIALDQAVATQHPAMLELSILTPSTQAPATLAPPSLVLIDTLSLPAGRGPNLPKGTAAFANSIDWLAYKVKLLVATSRRPAATLQASASRPSYPPLSQAVGPVPPQVLTAKNVFVESDVPPNDPYLKAFTAALTTWGYYHLVDTPQAADVVFDFHDQEANGIYVTLHPPNSKVILWTVTDPHYGLYGYDGQKRVTELTRNLISTFKQLNQIPLTPAETTALR
jgi:hypothetical protein